MDPYKEHMNKNLSNFSQFANQFSKVFIPIVDTALKMSTEEPVSAYGVFKAAKDLAGNKKNSKKQYNGSTKDKTTNKSKVTKLACAPGPTGTKSANSLKNLNVSGRSTKKNRSNGKKTHTKQVSGDKNSQNNPYFKGSEVINLVEQLYTDDPKKKLSKAEKKKKKDLEDYLANQLEMDDEKAARSGESFDTESSDEEEDAYFSSSFDVDSDERTISKSGSFVGDLVSYSDQESSSTNDDDNKAAEALAQAILSKTNKKSKRIKETIPKAKSIATSVVTEAKKSKKVDTKLASHKALPGSNKEQIIAVPKRRRSSLVSLDDFSKKSTPNAAPEKTDAKKPKKDDAKPASYKALPASNNEKNIAEEPKRRRSSLASIDEFSKYSTPKATTRNISSTANVKLEPLTPPSNIVKINSIEEGKRAFKWLLNPVTVDDFFAKYWEQKACLIKRKQSNYFGHLISFESIDQMLLKNHVEFTKNIDVTSYKNGVRETLNPEGRALPPVVWDHYGQGCSIRLLNPQTFLQALFTLSTTMQEYFHCLVGANAYLTPPNSQGFAPHYDDIEAFVLQIEGRKRWKLYKPRSTSEILPRYSSKNFAQQDIGKPVLEEVLEPGDVLYFPRGTIHQACTEPGYHSLHITLSVYQRQSYADLFEKMLPLMLQKAIATNVDLRRGLPLYTWRHAGIANSDNTTKERDDLMKKVTQLMHKFIREMPLEEIMDAGVDQMAKKFQHEALPPEILPAEKLRTVFGSRSRTNERGECVCDYDIDERTNVRLLRANILRLVEEEEKIRIYYYLDNSKEYCEYETNFIEIEAKEAASVEVLIKSYPQYIGVSQLPLPSDDEKISLITALWERGLLMMEKAFR